MPVRMVRRTLRLPREPLAGALDSVVTETGAERVEKGSTDRARRRGRSQFAGRDETWAGLGSGSALRNGSCQESKKSFAQTAACRVGALCRRRKRQEQRGLIPRLPRGVDQCRRCSGAAALAWSSVSGPAGRNQLFPGGRRRICLGRQTFVDEPIVQQWSGIWSIWLSPCEIREGRCQPVVHTSLP